MRVSTPKNGSPFPLRYQEGGRQLAPNCYTIPATLDHPAGPSDGMTQQDDPTALAAVAWVGPSSGTIRRHKPMALGTIGPVLEQPTTVALPTIF